MDVQGSCCCLSPIMELVHEGPLCTLCGTWPSDIRAKGGWECQPVYQIPAKFFLFFSKDKQLNNCPNIFFLFPKWWACSFHFGGNWIHGTGRTRGWVYWCPNDFFFLQITKFLFYCSITYVHKIVHATGVHFPEFSHNEPTWPLRRSRTRKFLAPQRALGLTPAPK